MARYSRGEEQYILTLEGLLERVHMPMKWHHRHANDVRYQSVNTGKYYTPTVARALRSEYASLIHAQLLELERQEIGYKR